ncbi:hypothetical protein [Rhodoferax sp.]|uniref:hypothetical protein n=1 Tax=Rhodoferax sp. TaxID=50421 RepID=UPI0027526953|nr:hypothetical protein [Rhodoferax sp.]
MPIDATVSPGAATVMLTPRGHVLLARELDAPALSAALPPGLLEPFARGAGPGLLHLGADPGGQRAAAGVGLVAGLCRALCGGTACRRPAHARRGVLDGAGAERVVG